MSLLTFYSFFLSFFLLFYLFLFFLVTPLCYHSLSSYPFSFSSFYLPSLLSYNFYHYIHLSSLPYLFYLLPYPSVFALYRCLFIMTFLSISYLPISYPCYLYLLLSLLSLLPYPFLSPLLLYPFLPIPVCVLVILLTADGSVGG